MEMALADEQEKFLQLPEDKQIEQVREQLVKEHPKKIGCQMLCVKLFGEKPPAGSPLFNRVLEILRDELDTETFNKITATGPRYRLDIEIEDDEEEEISTEQQLRQDPQPIENVLATSVRGVYVCLECEEVQEDATAAKIHEKEEHYEEPDDPRERENEPKLKTDGEKRWVKRYKFGNGWNDPLVHDDEDE